MILPPSTTFFWAPLWGAGFTNQHCKHSMIFHVTASESAAVRITFFLVWQRHSAVLPVLCTSSLKSLKLFVSLQRRGRKLQRVATMPTLQNLSPRRNTLDPPLGSGWWWSHPSQKNCMEKCEKSHWDHQALMAFYPNPDPPRFCFMPRRMKCSSASKTGSANFRARKSASAASLTSPGSRRSCSEANCSTWPCCRTTRATNVISALRTAWGVWVLGEHRTSTESTTCQSLSVTLRVPSRLRDSAAKRIATRFCLTASRTTSSSACGIQLSS